MLNLENKCFYRLVKVMYVFFLAVCFIIIGLLGWETKPYQVIDGDISYFTCPNGERHSFDSLDLYVYSSSFSSSDAEKAISECNKHHKKNEPVTDSALLKIFNSNSNHWKIAYGDPYPTTRIYTTRGSWVEVIQWWVLGFFVVFLIINVIKQSLLYIVYGKKFTFSW